MKTRFRRSLVHLFFWLTLLSHPLSAQSTVTLDFDDLPPISSFSSYTSQGYELTNNATFNPDRFLSQDGNPMGGFLPVFGNSVSSFTRTDGFLFSPQSIDFAGGDQTITFTGLKPDGSTVTTSLPPSSSTFQTFTFPSSFQEIIGLQFDQPSGSSTKYDNFVTSGPLFSYQATAPNSSDAIPYDFVDISTTSPALSLTLNSGDEDDGGALITLESPFPFYDDFHTQIVMSTNGYLSFNPADTGNDFSNDADLSTPPSPSGPRIYPLHDDLVADSPATLHYQYFSEGLRDFPLLPTTGVHVFQWTNIRFLSNPGNTTRFSFQALLFDDGTIHFVYPFGNPQLGSGSTTGILNADASINLLVAANTAGSIPNTSTATIFPPTLTVTSNADSGPGTLRQAIADAPNPARITFDPSVFNSEANRTINLTSGQLSIPATALTIDAQSICGLTLDAGGNSRILNTAANSTTILDALNITGGRAVDHGGILNRERLTVLNSSIYRNETENSGGGLGNLGSARLENTTIHDNGTGRIGSNPEPNFGGGIVNNGPTTSLTLISCTISANEASGNSGGVSFFSTQAIVQDTVIAGNSAPTSLDVRSASNNLTSRGGNFIGSNEGFTGAFPVGNPNLNGDYVGTSSSPLAPGFVGDTGGNGPALINNGGPTLTLMPLPGSPLINNSSGSNTGPDQRGVTLIDTRDIGAVETTWNNNLNTGTPSGLDVTLPTDLVTVFPLDSSPVDSVSRAIDNTAERYFNLNNVNSGFDITPSLGASNLTSLIITSSNSAGRGFDPTTFILLGSNGNDHFVPLASAQPNFTTASQERTFTFNTPPPSYTTYRLIFPEVVSPNQNPVNGVQIEEVQLIGFPEEGATPRILSCDFAPIPDSNPPRSTVTLTYTSRPDRLYGIQQAQSTTSTLVLDNTNNYTSTIAPGVTISQPTFASGQSGQVIFTGATAALGTSDAADFNGATFNSIGNSGGGGGDGGNPVSPANFVNNAIAYTLRDDSTGDLYDVLNTFFRSPAGTITGTSPSPDNTAGLVIQVTPVNLTGPFEFINITGTLPDPNSFSTTTSANFDTAPSGFFRVTELIPGS